MTKAELLARLRWLKMDKGGDPEYAHGKADDALLEFIDDEEITDAFEDIEKWYA